MVWQEMTALTCTRFAILGRTRQGQFAIKGGAEGIRCFVKVKGRWRNTPSAVFHHYFPPGVGAVVRMFTYEAASGLWAETSARVSLWHPEAN